VDENGAVRDCKGKSELLVEFGIDGWFVIVGKGCADYIAI
jgi:hypothetical protein